MAWVREQTIFNLENLKNEIFAENLSTIDAVS